MEKQNNKKVLIKTEKLSKSFSVAGKQQHIIKNLDLEIRRGDFTVKWVHPVPANPHCSMRCPAWISLHSERCISVTRIFRD